ncbi:hypothetical protein IQ235_15760 [Oscillatoriales cyanobacterium LEGE 11467]|uniref:Uncharacterized protein n=1 Tax=Zarconia navalis LEGE 11467 TaxID=1828826 RepID=A0A928Z946_9CYAN|nr:hypothetical protein [Zarconia navalis]MBE9042235.1 hypothetical protein [Zarconia navalis LEGE 11467]
MTAIRPFLLGRVFDPVGISGVGHVAEGGVLVNADGSTGIVILAWQTRYRSVSVYPTLEALKQIQCRDNNTLIIDAQALRIAGKREETIAERLPAPFYLLKNRGNGESRDGCKVACGCQFSNAKVGLMWTIAEPIVSWFDNIADLQAIHVRDNRSRIVWAKPSEF